MIAFFDTETTGLPNKRSPRLELQPHVLQLAVSLYDNERRPVLEISTLVKIPPEVKIDPKALDTHGITPAMLEQYGMQKFQAIQLLRFAFNRAELIVAHNLQFDKKLLTFETEREQRLNLFEGKRAFCTMEATVPLLKLPPTEAMIKWGHGDKFKSPKLSEAYQFLFNEDFEGAHDALADTRACARVYFELVDRGLDTLSAVS